MKLLMRRVEHNSKTAWNQWGSDYAFFPLDCDEGKGGEIVSVETIEVTYIRDFSVGYSAEETERLQRKFMIKEIINLRQGTISWEGDESNQGAFSGYYEEKIRVNGEYSIGGYGAVCGANLLAEEARRLCKKD